MSPRPVSARAPRRWTPLAVGLLTPVLLLAALAGGANAASSYPPLTGHIAGPNVVGQGLKGSYTVTATGGPAVGFNGTQVGTLSYEASVAGANTSQVTLLPSAGVFTNGTATISLTAGNVTQSLVLSVDVTSGYQGQNVSTNLSYAIQVVQPYSLRAQLVVESGIGTAPFNLSVLLDGTPVGSVAVPTLTGHSSYSIAFSYVNQNLAPGEHTFSINLANEHGLVVFSNGQEFYSQSFYVTAPPINYTPYYILAGGVFVAAIFIFLTTSGARRRGRKR